LTGLLARRCNDSGAFFTLIAQATFWLVGSGVH
jgi:hypothetical protein